MKMKKEMGIKIYFLIFILISLGNIAATVFTAARYCAGVKTEAQVIDVQHKKIRYRKGKGGSTSSNITKITFKYYANDTEYEKTIKLSGKKHIKEGDEIKISYNSKKPENVYLAKKIAIGIQGSLTYTLITILQIIIYLRINKSKEEKNESEINYSERM